MHKIIHYKKILFLACFLITLNGHSQNKQIKDLNKANGRTWTADNGNGTYTNPIFYEDFCDPDIIRVGEDFYMTGTSMHVMPGLPVMHSRDLVNWELISYVFDRLDLGPEFRLEDEQGKGVYSYGIWAPCIRYNKGTFYILADIPRYGTFIYSATNPKGPWKCEKMNGSFHDMSVLFDDDGKNYIMWGAGTLQIAQLTENLLDTIPGTNRLLTETKGFIDEGAHLYKINGKYYFTAIQWKRNPLHMACGRADNPYGPYEMNPAITEGETFGLAKGYRLVNPRNTPPFRIIEPHTNDDGNVSIAQGGLVKTATGEWWGFAHNDYNSVGRPTSLVPITWKDGWPYIGLEGNLKRAPRTWIKPNTGYETNPYAPYRRNDNFDSDTLNIAWQWNHLPDDNKWSLTEHPGFLRLHSLPSKNFWVARNTITQKGVGPESEPTVELEADGLQIGDIAGLALLTAPYSWIGLERTTDGISIAHYNEMTNETLRLPFNGNKIWLRVHCDYLKEKAQFSYSTDGKNFRNIGNELTMFFQIKTFQGTRYALFNFNVEGKAGGYADFDNFVVNEPHPNGLIREIPYKKTITLTNSATESLVSIDNESKFKIIDCNLGRVALKTSKGYVSVNADGTVSIKKGKPEKAETFQWIETPYGDLVLLSLVTNRYLHIENDGSVNANSIGPKPDRKDGTCLIWQ